MVGSDQCPLCSSDSTVLATSRSIDRPLLRRRQCNNKKCALMWSTHEVLWIRPKALERINEIKDQHKEATGVPTN